jgi:hypothetical protein
MQEVVSSGDIHLEVDGNELAGKPIRKDKYADES